MAPIQLAVSGVDWSAWGGVLRNLVVILDFVWAWLNS